ncbi:MAG: hypothetical protein K5793_09030 [Nitrosarchaeum sp.]|nr:hypothetical protein [Nitrosarchaeum sp.]
MAKLEKSLTILLIITAIIGMPTLFVQTASQTEQLNVFFDNQYVKAGLAIALLMLVSLAFPIFGIIVIKLLTVCHNAIRNPNFLVKITDESELHIGGSIFLEATFKGTFSNGYIITHIRSPYGEVKKYEDRYEKDKKLGRIRGTFKNDIPVNWVCEIPETFHHGTYHVTIELFDITTWLFSIRTTQKLTTERFDVPITKQQEKPIDIQTVIKPHIKSLNAVDLSSKPLSGWICIKTYNDSKENKNNCFGIVKTDMGQFSLYDYESFLRDGKTNLDGYASFSFDAHSAKRLFAEIKSNTTIITVSIDLGKEQVSKELVLDQSAFS